jgi:mRNA interferase MazF
VVTPGVKRGDVILVSLGHGQGGEIRKTRLCVVVSPDVLNEHMPTYIVAPMTSGGHTYPFRVLLNPAFPRRATSARGGTELVR